MAGTGVSVPLMTREAQSGWKFLLCPWRCQRARAASAGLACLAGTAAVVGWAVSIVEHSTHIGTGATVESRLRQALPSTWGDWVLVQPDLRTSHTIWPVSGRKCCALEQSTTGICLCAHESVSYTQVGACTSSSVLLDAGLVRCSEGHSLSVKAAVKGGLMVPDLSVHMVA